MEDRELDTRVVQQLVAHGDLSSLNAKDRAALYLRLCGELGLNPRAQPFAFLRLNGKEVLYATRGATDQLAAIHNVTREITDGPKVVDLAGTKVVFCSARATLPSGRAETSIATVQLIDPANVLMKAETKAKRRATLALLGLAVLDEVELETIPAGAMPSSATHVGDDPLAEGGGSLELPEPFVRGIDGIELPGEAVTLWLRHRDELVAISPAAANAGWTALCARVGVVGKMNGGVWLKKAVAEEVARRERASVGAPRGVPPPEAPATPLVTSDALVAMAVAASTPASVDALRSAVEGARADVQTLDRVLVAALESVRSLDALVSVGAWISFRREALGPDRTETLRTRYRARHSELKGAEVAARGTVPDGTPAKVPDAPPVAPVVTSAETAAALVAMADAVTTVADVQALLAQLDAVDATTEGEVLLAAAEAAPSKDALDVVVGRVARRKDHLGAEVTTALRQVYARRRKVLTAAEVDEERAAIAAETAGGEVAGE